ncbi:MFS transporter [Streptomyces sp. NA04227]|uniref:MFS transporter n=1 Tax=Streptomyces sp. NA04227 TaxID=2742136 RepID=UPI0015928E41|nr:MFS transporter [Streptomyces sp. NA04227]QKW08673.1 MFS transporter [Streptomyces sp. NA04227]
MHGTDRTDGTDGIDKTSGTDGTQGNDVRREGEGAPQEELPVRWVLALCLAVLGTFAGWFGPLQILLAKQADAFAPGDKEDTLALVALLGAAVSVVANPLWGALSDRTNSRFGRRVPWIAGGTLGGVAGLGLLAAADGITGMIIGWCLVQLALNAPFAALSAAIPDRVPEHRRGAAGGWFGIAQTVGVIAGTGAAVAGRTIVGGYLACAALVLLSVLPYLVLGREVAVGEKELATVDGTRAGQRSETWSETWSGLWSGMWSGMWISPRRHPDFGWAWLTRFLMNLSNAIALLYLLFFLQDAVEVDDPDAAVLVLTVVNALTVLLTVVWAGVWSDRIGRRRIFVTVSGLLMAAASGLLALAPTWTCTLVAAALLGVGFGVFTSVDFALITLVLPAEADHGKDLGLLNIASSLPQVLAPVIAAPIVGHVGGYPALYGLSALTALIGAALVHRITGVP